MKISVTLPNYNHGHYIRDNFDGLLAQTYQNWELHVVDDGSTDGSAQIIADYAARDARIKPIYFPYNQGAEAALECGIKAADGELLHCTAADDYICNPHFFEMAVGAFQNTTAAVFSGGLEIYNTENNTREIRKYDIPSGFLSPKESMEAIQTLSLPLSGQGAIFKREKILNLNKNKAVDPYTDSFMIAAIAIQSGSEFYPEVMAVNRSHSSNYSQKITLKKRFTALAHFEKALKNIPLSFQYNESLWKTWRTHWIVYFIEEIIQNEHALLNKIHEFIKSIPQKNKDDFGSHIRRIFNIFNDSNEIVQADMHELANKAAQIFNEIAGSLE